MVFMLLIIVASVACYCRLDFDHVESKEDEAIEKIIEEEQNQEVVESSTMKKIQFNKFSTALNYYDNYLKTCKGYKTYLTGSVVLHIGSLVDISQNIKGYTSVNNVDKKNSASWSTTGTGKIKANTGFQFTTIDGEVSWRKARFENDKLVFDNQTVERKSEAEAIDEWGVEPFSAFTGFDVKKIKDGNLIKNGTEFILEFTVSDPNVSKQNTKFIKRLFGNSKNAQAVNPDCDGINVKLILDSYGRPKRAEYSFTYYNLDLTGCGIPLSDLGGSVSYSQQFYNLDQMPVIEYMPDKIEE